MPLTPAEVHNVAFKKPPINKRGYDEEEVDAFLDIVEVELSRLIEENNELRARSAGAAPVQAADDGASAAELAAVRAETTQLRSYIAELERTVNEGKDGPAQQVVALQHQLSQTEERLAENRRELERAQRAAAEAQAMAQAQLAPGQTGEPVDSNTKAVGLLVLAQQIADQHVAQSKAEADRLLVEARNSAEEALSSARETSATHVSEAEARAAQLDEESSARAEHTVKEAEQRAAEITAHFEQRKHALERRVEELRTFEREYRGRLKGYLESQLRDLDAGASAGSTPAERTEATVTLSKAEPPAADDFAGAQQS